MFLAAVTAATVAPAARAGSSLSEFLSQKIAEAHRAESHRQFELALSLYQQAIEAEHGSGEDLRVLLKKRAAVYEQINMIDKAEADLTAAFKVKPFDPQVYLDRGYFYLRRTRYDEALSDFIAGTQFDPSQAQFFHGAARTLVAAKDFVSAVNFYGEAIRREPRNARYYLGRAEAQVNLNLFRKALTDYDQALALGLTRKGDVLFAYTGRGYANLALADYAAAVRDLDQASAIDPEAPNVLLWRAYAFERQGERDLALRDYEHAALAMPDNLAARAGVQRLRASCTSGC